MKTNALLFGLLLTLATGSALSSPTADALSLAKTIPIADAHMHTYRRGGPPAEAFLEQMDKNGVKWGGGVGDYREDVARLLGKRHIPAVGQAEFARVFFSSGANELVNEQNPIFVRFFAEAERLFANGQAKGFGELHTDNHTSGPMRMRRQIRTDNPVMRRFYSIANNYGGFVQIHSQLEPNFVEDVLRLSADFPNTTTILSHCLPKAKPYDLEKIFEQRTNVMCELSAQGVIHNRLAGVQRPARAFPDDGLKDWWKKAIERFPDRFMVGSDACCGWFGSYTEMIQEIRTNLLPHLKPEIMEAIAYKNAVRVFSLTD